MCVSARILYFKAESGAMLKQELSFDDKTIKTEDILVSYSMNIGGREYQQDYALVPGFDAIQCGKYLCVLCDGMGGMEHGDLASKMTADYLYDEFSTADPDIDYSEFLSQKIIEVNKRVSGLEDPDGNPLETGSTVVAIIVDNGKLHWASVGDSRIYLLRDGHLDQLTTDQNYGSVLLEELRRGMITVEEANSDPLKDALTNYIGMEKTPTVDLSSEPLDLQDDDVILMCSDGLYRTLEDEEIAKTMASYIENIPLAAYMLIQEVKEKNMAHQDNVTVILSKYKYTEKTSEKENDTNGYEEM